MNQLVFIQNKQVLTDSLTIADVFEKEHKHVVRDIENQISKLQQANEIEFAKSNFGLETFKASNNKEAKKFTLTEDAFTLVAMSYTTPEAMKFKVKFIQEFKRMREYIEKQEQQAQDPVELALQTSLKNYQEIKMIKDDVTYLKDHMRIDGVQEYALNSQGKAKVLEVLGGYESAAYNAVARKAFSELWRDFKRHFQLPRYSELPKTKFDEAVYFISKWRPSTSLEIEIESYNKQTQLKLVK